MVDLKNIFFQNLWAQGAKTRFTTNVDSRWNDSKSEWIYRVVVAQQQYANLDFHQKQKPGTSAAQQYFQKKPLIIILM